MATRGRGGAGNIDAIAQENARISADLEANQSAADHFLNDALPSTERKTQSEQIPYARTGRGGAGNFVDANDVKHSLGEATPSTIAPESAERPTTFAYGRGGAGNHEFAAGVRDEEAIKQREGEHVSREALKAEIERRVKDSLAMPQKAKIAGSEPY